MKKQAYKILLEVFKERKYTIISEDIKEIEYTTKTGEKGTAILVVNRQNVKAILSLLIEKYDQITIVCDVITPNFKKISEASQDKIEFFQYDELQFNIIEHEFQPKFMTMNAEEMVEWKKLYMKSAKTYPKILKTDPVSRFYKLKLYDVLKIERDDLISYSIIV